jgi:GAG-pre-integrase domain
VDGLVNVQNKFWFGVSHTPETVTMHTQKLNEQRTNYIKGVTEEGLIGNLESLKHHSGRNWLTDERHEKVYQTYVAKAQALDILHMQLGHLHYQRIERLIQKRVIKGFKIDKQLVDALVKERCDICMQSKQRVSSHGGKLPLPTEAWRCLSTNLSAKFAHPSICGNIYQMAIIETKTKYVWDYYLKTENQCFEYIQE